MRSRTPPQAPTAPGASFAPLRVVPGDPPVTTGQLNGISTAHGLKFTEFKVRYHESQLDGIRIHEPEGTCSPPAEPLAFAPRRNVRERGERQQLRRRIALLRLRALL